jgi:uncharacterized membrane protein YkvA (DUF1232 family)
MSTPRVRTPLESFYGSLQKRVAEWLQTPEAATFPCSELYRYLPDLFDLLAHLALDHRVPESERRATFSALKYIVAPFDLIPEGIHGTAGFRDDLVLAALVLDRLAHVLDAEILRDHWRHQGEPAEIARLILDAGDKLVGPELCGKLKEWLPAD